VRFAEQHGLDVTYATDLTIEQHPSYLLVHKALLSLGHDECWSFAEREAAVLAHARGLNIAFFAASPVLRHVRLQASPLGPGREEVDYRDGAADPANGHGDPRDDTGNTWSDPPARWSEVPFVGATYAGYLLGEATAPFRVADGQAWIFDNTGLQTGAEIPGLLHSDFDAFDPNMHHASEQIFGHSPVPPAHSQGEVHAADGKAYSDMTYYTDRTSGAGVFDSGTNNWVHALDAQPLVAIMTGNLLRVFGLGPAGRTQPSVANWKTFYPNA
jgi:hypothetical protein